MSQKSIINSAESLLQIGVQRVQHNTQIFHNKFPNYGDDAQYNLNENNNWVAGFWPGMVWLAYAQTGDDALSEFAATLLPSFKRRLDENIHVNHDMGFLFTLSARAQYQLTGDEVAAKLAMRAADVLLGRYRPNGRYIQAWGPVGEEGRGGQMIMDTMMNLPLLFWAEQRTGDHRYGDVALAHAKTMATHNVRPDGSTFHTFFFDQESGEPLRGETHQGAADGSLWARGQAWGICGFAMAAQWCPDERLSFIETARTLGRRFMAELPADDVPLWDLWLPEGAPDYRDSSAGSIALVGLLRLIQINPEHAAEYQAYAKRLFDALIEHCWDGRPEAQGLLLHGASHVPKGLWMDAYMIYGDYFMLEALTMMTGKFTDLWVSNDQNKGPL
ncbi:MAG: unsaturated chondroitin disaccharide hydrolase [Cellvibrionaceae bacterium]|jgi:unsaturated chondroitin disaccharide hydrolase